MDSVSVTSRDQMSILDQSYAYGRSPLTPDSKSKRLCTYLFGGRISHSHSPAINSRLFAAAGVPWTYELCETTDPQRFEDVLHQSDCIGASVTMPNKVAFMAALDDLTEEARAIGAVNTVFIRLDEQGRRRYIGTNTDCVGIRETLLHNSRAISDSASDRPALVIGAGGAARSALFALWTWFQPREIYLTNRLKSEAADLVEGIQKSIPGIKVRHVDSVAEAQRLPAPEIVIGTVPDDEPREAGEVLSWQICKALLRRRDGDGDKGAVLDMCYQPARTRLLRLAEERGWAIMLGTEVLPITLKLSGKVIKNRIYRTPLSEYASTYDEKDIEKTGIPKPRYVELYQELADGGAGLICFGNIPIDRDNLENYNNAVLDPRNPWDPVAAFGPAIRAARSRGALCLPQLQFPGRQVPEFLNPRPKSASDVQLGPCLNKTYGKPVALTKAEIAELVARYVWAADVLAQAGADGIMLHGAHGYILNQFLSPLTNRRTDEYGGSLENRARFILEIVNAIKAKLPSDQFVIAVKFNCQDFIQGGQSFAEQCVVIKWLEEAGVDFFDISGGTYASPAWRGNIMTELAERPSQKARGSYFVEWAQEMKKVLSRAVIGTTGGWRDSHRMAEAVENGDVDMIGLGRTLREDPFFVTKAIKGEIRLSKL
ncbi:uncharacterized protein PV07_05100 [Cladophialophora immunda]|uniref:NADH:flavin oxidoreductase/NADH oxidase N-terminal domain-containing protein n=1 Tax=Cladophialophora immunda TaxID=569365 RepID=A0A0D2CGC6_9EURO|nr:uncharacterized protein PV07_05100 [Cladophialophora immunda]KIW29275.1 hypothetical protein PV07_05100 [Cladophialophora immunda]